ncbi:MAG: TatD family hydrolase [bacterium]|nr:TatD family hydrolase [bacterium]
MNFVDTHCHLQFDKLATNLDQVINDAGDAGVTRLICVGTNVDDSQKAVDIAAKHENIWATIGVHPHDGKNFFEQKNSAVRLQDLLTKPRVVAVGEIGLDFYKNYSPKADQEKLLRLQIEIGIPTGLPFVFHVREAFSDFWRIFDAYPNLRGVIHSFSATSKELDQALSRGLYVALNGIMTFTSDQAQLEAAKQVPKDKLLLETDAPFLTPKAHRGKTCEPKHIRDIAEFLATLRGEDIKELAGYTTKNAKELFGI